MKITHFPLQAHCFAFGGFELQMLGAIDAVEKVIRTTPEYTGIEVNKIDVWSRKADFDIAHFWSLSYVNSVNIEWAKKAGKKIVVTTLFGTYSTVKDRFRHYVSSQIYRVRLNKELVPLIDALVVVNDYQKSVAIRFFGFSPDQIFVIPNIVHDNFFSDRQPINNLPFEKFVLCTGNVCQRKNQLRLAKAAVMSESNLVLVGKVMEGERDYGATIDEFVSKNKNVYWYKGLPENSELLIDLVRSCEAFALPSFGETQPISLLEAGASRKPVIFSNRQFAKQKYYDNACLVEPSSVKSITAGLLSVLKDPSKFVPPANNLSDCKEENVGKAYMDVYNYVAMD